MKNVLYNYYNILVDELDKMDNYYSFYYNDTLYFFCLVLNDVNLVEEIYKYLKINNISCYDIILNKDNSLFSVVDNKKYALIRVNGILKYEINFFEFKFYPVDKSGVDWGKLWAERLDYYEVQLRELGKNYQTVLNSFGLFSGLAENAILYYNLTIKNFDDSVDVGIVHNRLMYPCYYVYYNNPINFVIDYSVRDLAEYFKSYIFSDDFNINELFGLLDKVNFNNKTFNLLYSRLMYPSFYFDVFDKVILENGKDDDVLIYVNNTYKYLNVLKSLFDRYSAKYNMFRVEWLYKIKM